MSENIINEKAVEIDSTDNQASTALSPPPPSPLAPKLSVNNNIKDSAFEVIFMGTGVSTGVPCISCILQIKKLDCSVCFDATNIPSSKNRRNNVSIAVKFNDELSNTCCVIVDVGKTMRDAVLNIFPKHQIQQVDAILLTHGHADAIYGLDDVRDLQTSHKVTINNTASNNQPAVGFQITSGALPIYLHQETMETVQSAFPYLTNKPEFYDESKNILKRRVAYLNFQVIPTSCPLNLYGLPCTVFPVYHGGTYISLGFAFGQYNEFVYISDVKIIPDESMKLLKAIPCIETLVIDALDYNGIYSHIGIYDAIKIANELNPKRVYFVGMSCFGLHDDLNRELATLRAETFLAFDGMVLQFQQGKNVE